MTLLASKFVATGALGAALVACGGAPTAPAAPAASTASCGAPLRGLETVLDAGLLLIGELHGTEQSPAFATRVLCERAAAGPVVLAVELPPEQQAPIDAFLASDGSGAARSALLTTAFWTRGYQDGRTSQAMVDLLDSARRLRGDGRDIRVATFDIAEPLDGNRDALMASNLLALRRARPSAPLLVLTGNFHATTTRNQHFPQLTPMGIHLRAAVPALVSLDVDYHGGSAWICSTPDAASCGAAAMGGDDRGSDVFVERRSDRPGYDGIYYVGTLTASPPAVAPVAGAPSCDEAASRMTGVLGDKLFGHLASDKRDGWRARMGELLVAACTEDRWPRDVLACAGDARDGKAMNACLDRLGEPEQDLVMERMNPFMAELVQDLPPDAP